MTMVTVRPDASTDMIPSVPFTVVGGGGDIDLVLRDNSDSTWLSKTTPDSLVSWLRLGLPAPSAMPGGAIPVKWGARARSLAAGSPVGSGAIVVANSAELGSGSGTANVNWAGIVTHTVFNNGTITAWPTTAAEVYLLGRLDSGSNLAIFELYIDYWYATQPVCTVTGPSEGATITDNNRPTATWTRSLDPDGGPQTVFQVKVFDDATYGGGGFNPDTSTPDEDSGIVGGSNLEYQVQNPLIDDTYRFYVRIGQTINGVPHWSPWDNNTFTLAVPLPAVPTLAVTADSAMGRIGVNVTSNSGTATTDKIEVEVSRDAGVTWEKLRTIVGDGLFNTPFTANPDTYDYDQPNGIQALFRARALHTYAGFFGYSAFSSNQSATWTSTSDFWFKSPAHPNLNTKIMLKSPATDGVVEEARRGVFQSLGEAKPVVTTDTPMAKTGVIAIICDDAADKNALDALRSELSPLLFQCPLASGESDKWLALGRQLRRRIVDLAGHQHTVDEIEWIEVNKPGVRQVTIS